MKRVKIFVAAGLVAVLTSISGWVLVDTLATNSIHGIGTTMLAGLVIACVSGVLVGFVGHWFTSNIEGSGR